MDHRTEKKFALYPMLSFLCNGGKAGVYTNLELSWNLKHYSCWFCVEELVVRTQRINYSHTRRSVLIKTHFHLNIFVYKS